MILIADSGSTKTDFVLVDNGTIVSRVITQGINPYSQSSNEIIGVLNNELIPKLSDIRGISDAYFYGSGCRDEKIIYVEHLLRKTLHINNIHVYGDLLGAAHALCGNKEGIACILGTGANSCLYNGTEIVMNTPPLGYILGDEGSGAVLGRNFINAIFKGSLPQKICLEFVQDTGLTLSQIIDKVYRQPLANRFLASISIFIYKHIDNLEVQELVIDNFNRFIHKDITPYNHPELPLNFIGSIAFLYEYQLRKAVKNAGLRIGTIERSPIKGLIKYHL